MKNLIYYPIYKGIMNMTPNRYKSTRDALMKKYRRRKLMSIFLETFSAVFVIGSISFFFIGMFIF